MTSDRPLRLRFGPFELDEEAWELRKSGGLVSIEPKPFAVLLHLARHRDRVVRRNELLAAVWPGLAVSDDAVYYALGKVREALGERGNTGGSIQTIRGLGLRFVAAVGAEEPAPDLSPVRPRVPTRIEPKPTLIGRAEELVRLDAALASALAGAGRIALISGEAGIGKTQLAEATLELARRRNAERHVAWARVDPGAPPFWMWAQLLRSYADTWTRDALVDAMGSDAGELARIEPTLPIEIGAARSRILDSAESYVRLLEALSRFLTRASRQRPQVLVLEDLQWADPSSLSALGFLARPIRQERILVVTTVREEEVLPDHPIRAVLLDAERHESLVRIPLRGLDEGAFRKLISDVTGFSASAALAASLHARTSGNPFFAKQILGLLLERPPQSDVELGEQLSAHLHAMPPGLRLAASRRLEGLSTSCREMLDAACVLDREFSVAVLSRVCDLASEDLAASLHEAAQTHLIEPSETAADHHRFVHDVVREVLYAELAEPRRLQLHRRVAESLEALHAGHLTPVVPLLAYHYGKAALLLDGTEAVDYAKDSGELARNASGYREAAKHFEQALRALALRPHADPTRRAELLICLGYARHDAGEHEGARQALREGAAIARSAGAIPLLAAAALGLAEIGVGVVDADIVALIEEASRGLGEKRSFLRLWTDSVLAVHLANQPARRAEADQIVARAEAAARDLGQRRWIGVVLVSRAAVARLSPNGKPEERIALLDEAIALSRRVGDPRLELLALLQRQGAHLELGDGAAVRADFGRIQDAFSRLRSSYWRFVLPSLRATRHILDGDYQEAERLAREAFLGADHPSLPGTAPFFGLIAAIRYQQGCLADMLPIMASLADEFSHLPVLRSLHLLALLDAGRRAEAKRRFEEFARGRFATVVGTESWTVTLALLADLCVELDDRRRAGPLLRLLEPRAQWCAITANGHYCHGPIALYVGRLATLRREWDAAEAYLEVAIARARSLESAVWRAHVLGAQAELYAARGPRSDLARARHLTDEARTLATSIGLGRLLQRLAGPDRSGAATTTGAAGPT